MSIDNDWKFKAEHWEREAKRLISQNISLKTNSMKYEHKIYRLEAALKEISEKDETGEMMYELREDGPSIAIGRSKGKFSEIAQDALSYKVPK